MNSKNAAQFIPFVKALGEGKTLQFKDGSGKWNDLKGDIGFSYNPSDYRIKAEPLEIWANVYSDGTKWFHESEEKAKRRLQSSRGRTVHFREVIQ